MADDELGLKPKPGFAPLEDFEALLHLVRDTREQVEDGDLDPEDALVELEQRVEHALGNIHERTRTVGDDVATRDDTPTINGEEAELPPDPRE